MEELIEILKTGKEFFSGGDLVLFYIAYELVKNIIKPIRAKGAKIESFMDSLIDATQERTYSSRGIEKALLALNATLKERNRHETRTGILRRGFRALW